LRLEIVDDEGNLLGSVDWDGEEFVYEGIAKGLERREYIVWDPDASRHLTEEDGADYMRALRFLWKTGYAYSYLVDDSDPSSHGEKQSC
jgi:hypothetical protein